MWMASKNGFFSIVKIKNKDDFFVRARCREDLESYFGKEKVITSTMADYRYRVIVNQSELHAFVIAQCDIEYHNFKDSLYNSSQADKLHYYYQIWEVMHRYQERKAEPNP